MPGLPGLTTCTLITTSANEDVKPVHPRMPVVLTKETMWDWLEEDDPKALESLLRPPPAGSLIAYQVSRDVNSPQNQGEYLVEPIEEEGSPGIL